MVGLKPTLGAIPAETTRDAFGNNIYAGPLARTVTDAAVMHAALAGPSPRDPWTRTSIDHLGLAPSLIGDDLGAVHIGYIPRCANLSVAADVTANTEAALSASASLGAEIEGVSEPIDWTEYEGRILYKANFTVFCAQHLP